MKRESPHGLYREKIDKYGEAPPGWLNMRAIVSAVYEAALETQIYVSKKVAEDQRFNIAKALDRHGSQLRKDKIWHGSFNKYADEHPKNQSTMYYVPALAELIISKFVLANRDTGDIKKREWIDAAIKRLRQVKRVQQSISSPM